MTYRGRIKGGAIVLDGPTNLPEGASVKVEVEITEIGSDEQRQGGGQEQIGVSTLLKHAGCIDDLPEDASVNIDHYLYGHPKRD